MTGYSERRDASLRQTLTAIDDAVLDRCVSCHQDLSPDAPSPWWCSPDCQQAWSEQQVDNPREVLDRDDAAQVLVGMDAASVPLREPGERGWFRSALAAAVPDVIAAMEASVLAAEETSHAEGVMRSGGPDVRRTQGTAFEPRGMSPLEWYRAQSQAQEHNAQRLTQEHIRRLFDIPPEIDLAPPPRRGADYTRVWLDEMRGAETSLTVHNETHQWVPDEDWRRATDAGWLRRAIRRLTGSGGTA